MSGRSARAFDVYGVDITIDGDSEAVEDLTRHFAAFARDDASDAPAIRLTLRRAPPAIDLPPGTRADQIVDRGLVYNIGPRTFVDHHGHASTAYDFAREAGVVHAERTADLVELGYLALSSRLGAHLERRGFVRVHGVGVVVGGRAALVLAPSGGGKSTLARALLARTEATLLGDDIVLLDARGNAWPFPTPIGLTRPEQAKGLGHALPFERRLHPPKWIIPFTDVRERFARGASPLARVVLLTRVIGGAARIVPAPRAAIASALFRDAVVGLGLPQVLELVARRGARDLLAQGPSAARRARAVAAVLGRASGRILEAGDPGRAAACIVRDLQG